jgi:hypothetical protein
VQDINLVDAKTHPVEVSEEYHGDESDNFLQ